MRGDTLNTKLGVSTALFGIASLVALGGCAANKPAMQAGESVTSAKEIALPSPVRSQHAEFLERTIMQSKLDEQEGLTYRVGPGDLLRIDVYRHPELSSMNAPILSGRGAGTVVDNDGTIQVPLLGPVPVAGKTTAEIRTLLQQRLSEYIKDPSVSVQVQNNGSMRYNLIGEFAQPGLKFSDRPLHLMEALALGGSVNLANANLRGAYIVRDGQKLPINFYRLLRQGDLSQNIRLRAGDTIFIPDKSSEQAFVFGAVSKGGAVPFTNGRLDLLQALSLAGLSSTDITRGRLEDIRIIRAEGDRATFITVDASRIMRGEAAPFLLESGDIVYVPLSKVGSWNEVIGQIVPSLQLVSSLLNPFVQIKFLSQ